MQLNIAETILDGLGEKLMMSKEFISLREYLLLCEPWDNPPYRSIHKNESLDHSCFDMAQDLVKRYDLAKLLYEKYGDEGPPINSFVMTLHSGHGGRVGCKRKFIGTNPEDDRLFLLEDVNDPHNQRSLVDKVHWWNEICPVNMFPSKRK